MKQFLKNLIFGSHPGSFTREYKYAMLRGEYALIMILCCVLYIIYNSSLGVYAYIPYYTLGAAIGGVVIYLNRNAYYLHASIVFLITINIMIYLFADIQQPFGSVFLFFSFCALMGVVFLRDYHWALGYIFVLLPFLLGLLAYYTDFHLLGITTTTKWNFLINFTISMMMSLLFVRFLLQRNEDEIRERQLIEEELKVQNELLTKTNKELDHFVYSVSHDLRAPLSSIQGLTNLYDMTKSNQEREEINQMIKTRVKDLDAFIKEVLDYSRNERLELNISKTSPYAVMNRIVDKLDHMNGFDQVKLENKIEPSFEVNTDPERLQVIFTNLLVNAITYRDLTKSNCVITTATADLGDQWQFTIHDNGIGIREEHQHKIFDMFFRVDGHASDGSGLGLYIVHETVTRLEGVIKVESALGEGTAFVITFRKLNT